LRDVPCAGGGPRADPCDQPRSTNVHVLVAGLLRATDRPGRLPNRLEARDDGLHFAGEITRARRAPRPGLAAGDVVFDEAAIDREGLAPFEHGRIGLAGEPPDQR
jgi:hypothetical protein